MKRMTQDTGQSNLQLSASLALGSKAAAGNLKLYGVRKEDGSYIVPVDIVRKRIDTLEKRKHRIEEYLLIMKQVIS